MQSKLGQEDQKSKDSVDLRVTHFDWSPEATLIHFQGQSLSICELDYNILQQEIQNIPKTKAVVDVADFCLVEDVISARWFRGRVQKRKDDLLDVFLIDCGNILSVNVSHVSSCSDDVFILPPKIVSGFLANVLILQNCCHSVVEGYFSSLIGKNITGFIQAILPYKVHLLEAPDLNSDLVQHGFGRHVDRDTFLFLVSILTEMPLKQNIKPVSDLLIEKSRQEFCYESFSLQGYQDILLSCGPKLSIGTCAKVRVTAAVHPGLFYFQVANAAPELLQISRNLAKICEDNRKGTCRRTPENLGGFCAVKGKDLRWYRGFVQSLQANSQVRVFFIDYGFFETVKFENVHSLPPEVYSLQIRAFPCTIPSLTDQDLVFRTQQLDLIKAGLLGALLNVEVTGFDRDHYLYTINVKTNEDTHVEELKHIQNHSEPISDVKKPLPQYPTKHYDPILEEGLHKTLEAEEMQVGSVFVGYVEHAQNPNHFWIRTQKRNHEFEEMMSKIREHFSEVKWDEDVLLNPEVGAMCCALYEKDLHFYRGVVMYVLEHGAEILFIDYGNIEKMPHTLIKKLPKTFAGPSPFAACCTLANTFPFDDMWPSKTCQFFRSAVFGKALLIQLIQKKKNILVVDLFEMDSNNSITELLVSSKLVDYVPQIAVEENKDLCKARKLHCSKENWSKKSDQGQDCKEKVNLCKKEKIEVQPSFKVLKIKPGFEVSVRCSHINSPSDFWCQPVDGLPALEKLMNDIQLYYKAHTVPLHPNESCCVAKSPEDGRWYRGLIFGNRKRHGAVMLIDYGSIIQVRAQHLQAIMPEYLHLEGQAFRCSLYYMIEPKDPKYYGDWSPYACKLLKSFAFKSADALKCTVLSMLNVKNKGLYNVVSLHNTQTHQSFGDALIEQGLAIVASSSSSREDSDVFPESFIYSSFNLNIGDEEQIYVTQVSSQCEVYCHLDRNTATIEELETKILEESENMMQASSGASVTKLCLARYLDGKWYRGMEVPVQSSLHVRVFFVDYGNTNISEKKSVVFIPRNCEELLYTPMQALRFNLHSVPAEELYADALEWLTSAVLNKPVRVVVRGRRVDGSFDGELFDGDININERLKELILTRSQTSKTKRFAISSRKTEATNHHTKHAADKRKGSLKGQRTSPSKTRNAAKLKNTKNPAHGRSPNRIAKQENEPIGSGVQHIKPKQTKHRKEKERTLVSLPDKSINPGFRAKGFVSHIDSINCFFLQLLDDESTILKMAEDLNSSNVKNSLKLATNLSPSDIVLAEFEEDGALYRSIVLTQEDSSCYKVEFVDYGNTAVVEKEKIYLLPEACLSHPRFCIPCSLKNASAYKDEASFTEAVIENLLMVEFVCQSGIQWQVKLDIPDGNDESDETLSSIAQKNSEESPLQLSESVENTTQKILEEESHKTEKSTETESRMKKNRAMPEPSSKMTASVAKTQSADIPEGFVADVSTHQQLFFAPVETDKGYSGFAAAITTPYEFCVALEDLLFIMTKVWIMLDDLPGNMPALPKAHLVPGSCCLLKSESKNKWCRAEIAHTDTVVVMNLIDYGYYESLPYCDFSKLKQLPLELTKLPKMTYPCILRGVKPAGGDGQWSDDAVVFFKHCLYQKNIQIFFRESGSNFNWSVDVVADGVHVAKKLVDAGHADYVDVMLGLRFQVSSRCNPHIWDADEEKVFNERELMSAGSSNQVDVSSCERSVCGGDFFVNHPES